MATPLRRHLVVDALPGGVRMVRFTCPDLRDQLYDQADPETCPLFREIFECILAELNEGQSLILNFGLVEQFPTALYRWLLKVRALTAEAGVQLILCRLSPEHKEIFGLFRAFQLFHVTTTEARAVYEATGGKGCRATNSLCNGRSSDATMQVCATHPSV